MTAGYTETVLDGNTVLAIPKIFSARHFMPMGYLDQLASLRKKRGYTQAVMAERLGVEQPTYQRWETGKREPDLEQIHKMAAVLGVEAGALIDPGVAAAIGPRLYVKGEVAAGVWRQAFEMPEQDWQTFNGRADITADMKHRFGLRVTGDSMNLLYPHGTIVECVSVFGHIEPEPGKRVVVVRTNEHGEVEATVKELVEDAGELWLVPRSTNPAHRQFKAGEPEPGIREIRIAAVVVSSVRPE